VKRTLLVATKNKKKLKEIKEILKGLDFKVVSLADYPQAPRIIENGKSFKENAVKKAVQIARFSGGLTLGEDSGLCVDALGGAPGIYSSRFSGRNKSDSQNNLKLLKLLNDLPLEKRKARYISAVALADRNGLFTVVQGSCSGRIGYELKGNSGFGYDPLFIIPKYRKTFAELGEGIKHRMSHRFLALCKIKASLATYLKRNP